MRGRVGVGDGETVWEKAIDDKLKTKNPIKTLFFITFFRDLEI